MSALNLCTKGPQANASVIRYWPKHGKHYLPVSTRMECRTEHYVATHINGQQQQQQPTTAKRCHKSHTVKGFDCDDPLILRNSTMQHLSIVHRYAMLLHLAVKDHVQACHQAAYSSTLLVRHASLLCRAAHNHHWASDTNNLSSV